MSKKKVLFVGSFESPATVGHMGGQMIACEMLINSSLSEKVLWILFDTTAKTNKERFFLSRMWHGILRMFNYLYKLIIHKPSIVLLFCSGGWSFREKGLMGITASIFRKKVILAPRSGLIMDDIAGSLRFKKYVSFVLSRMDVLLCQSESWKDYYENIAGNHKLEYKIIENWIKPLYFDIAITPYVNGQNLTVLFIGWVTKNKGVFDILETAKNLRGEKIKFILAGDGDAFEELKEQIRKEGLAKSVLLPGWVDEKEKLKLIKQADVFILPSYREGYPNSLIEAMAAGLPVIASKTGSIPDIIINKKNGFLINPGDSGAITDQILYLKNNPEVISKIGKEARNTIKHSNMIDTAIKKFEILFDLD